MFPQRVLADNFAGSFLGHHSTGSTQGSIICVKSPVLNEHSAYPLAWFNIPVLSIVDFGYLNFVAEALLQETRSKDV